MTQNNDEALIEFKDAVKQLCNDFSSLQGNVYIKDVEAWQAATKASEIEINSLKERVKELEAEVFKAQSYFMKSQREIKELTASNNQLREALYVSKQYITEAIIDDKYHEASCGLDELYLLRNKAINLYNSSISSTPAQSLAQHDNATIDRCKNIVANDALAITFQSMGAYRSAIIKQIGELKASHD